METAIKVFLIIGTIFQAFYTLGIALFWCIPMTVHYFRNAGWVNTGYKVCTLLFVNTIAGILMFCDD